MSAATHWRNVTFVLALRFVDIRRAEFRTPIKAIDLMIRSVRTTRIACFFLLVSVALLALTSITSAQGTLKNSRFPRRVLIIRHAEKPLQDENSIHLSAEGWQRANLLHSLFEESADRPNPLPVPDFIFAAKMSKHSNRSIETVTPLAQKLKRNINIAYPDEEFEKLAREILSNRKYAGKTILISWHHGTIPELASRLKVTDAPKRWKDSVFDRVWQIDYDKDGQATFEDLPQRLPEPLQAVK